MSFPASRDQDVLMKQPSATGWETALRKRMNSAVVRVHEYSFDDNDNLFWPSKINRLN